MSAVIDRPHGTTVAALKGLAIAASFLTAGQLGTLSIALPGLYKLSESKGGPRLAAKQFAHLYRSAKATGPPAEILTTLICSGLAYIGYTERQGSWKLWAGAAGAMFAVIPWTIMLMEAPAHKLLWVAEVADSATVLPTVSSGIGVKVTDSNGSTVKKEAPPGFLGVKGHSKHGSITPIEEFEPFEDAMIAPEEYEQLKVRKILMQFNTLNTVRSFGPLIAGVLGTWAAFTG